MVTASQPHRTKDSISECLRCDDCPDCGRHRTPPETIAPQCLTVTKIARVPDDDCDEQELHAEQLAQQYGPRRDGRHLVRLIK